ncbi:hypothetical protein pdam_00020746 [Pocillopora damicornis]|uniref:F5/8 type C domain-containing protein n=1 Tax=Pocillopora damicornis TaxID=46731 RepID=A0A3M6TZN3_POCDA|nr:hypothetical protein pdam_00020746 [Pocillopora damicornis]
MKGVLCFHILRFHKPEEGERFEGILGAKVVKKWKMKNELYFTACHSQAIGVTSSDAIPDGSFSASSKANNARGPSAGRLNGNNWGWAPKTNTNHTDYLQIDLQYDYVICAVATQGSVNSDQWTTKYKIKLSLDGVTLNTYKENNTEKDIFSPKNYLIIYLDT